MFRPSQLDSYSRCPTAYYLSVEQDEDQTSWPIELGNSIHAAIEHWHKGGQLKDPFDFAVKEIESRWIDAFDEMSQKVIDADLQMLREGMTSYVRLFEASDIDEVLCEVPARMTIENIEIQGTLDQIRIDLEGNWHLIDIKTGKKHLSYEGLRRSMQIWAYSYAIYKGELNLSTVEGEEHWQAPNVMPHASILNFRNLQPYKRSGKWGKKGEFRGRPYSDIALSENGFRAFESRVKMTVEAMRRLYFPPNPHACETCSFTKQCAIHLGLDVNKNEMEHLIGGLEGIG